MSDLVVYTEDNVRVIPSFKNEELRVATEKIVEFIRGAGINYFKIAAELKWVKGLELYKEDGFSSVYDYAEKVFGYSKSSVVRMIKIAEEYLLEDGSSSVFVGEKKDFSISQLRELLSLPRGDVVDLVQEGQITPDMTKDQIRSVIKAKKSKTIDISEEENGDNKDICASAPEEKSDNNSVSESEDNQEQVQDTIQLYISSSSVISSDTSILESIPSNIDKSTLAILMSSTSSSSVSGDPSTAPRMPQESLSSLSGISTTPSNETALVGACSSISSSVQGEHEFKHELKASEIDFLINRINEESSEEEYPTTSYSYSYFNLSTEQRETKKVEEIEIRDLVMSDRGISTEVKDCFELLKKEIKRLKHFSRVESKRLEEQEKEIARLKEENYRLSHPVKRGRGRPRKNQ